jgi:catechol 2,3-dioxygenase-like lactoylglutathione lyase family enzyme
MHRSTVTFLLLALICPSVAFAPQLPPAVSGIHFVRLNVSDMKLATGFYRQTLKLNELTSGCSGSVFACFRVNDFQQIEVISTNPSDTQNLVSAVGLYTKDAAPLREYFVSRGLNPGPLQSTKQGIQFFEIFDPERHLLVFHSASIVLSSIIGEIVPVGDRILHVGFVVRDRAVMDHFYKDILGFHIYWHGGMKDDQTDWVDMQVPDGTDWIEYMLNVPPNASHKTLGVMNHIALGVPDIKAAREQLLKNGMNLTEEPHIGRDGKWQLNLYDPDGTRVELMEFTPVQKPCCSDYTGPHPKP